jgi:hypothetical protein
MISTRRVHKGAAAPGGDKTSDAYDWQLTKSLIHKVATGFLDQTRADGGEYKHTKFSLSYITTNPGPGHLFLAM